MISKKHILEAINKSIAEKCWTKAQIQEKLSALSREEKIALLKGRLTPLEWEDYNSIVDSHRELVEEWEDRIKKGQIDKDKIPEVYEFLKDMEKTYTDTELFKYERRIFENYTVPTDLEIPVINEKDYVHDESIPFASQDDENYYDLMMGRDRINPVEAKQIELQENNVYLTANESRWISSYFLDNYTFLKNRINHNTDVLEELYDHYELAELEHDFPYMKKHMDNAISKTDGLVEPTILFHSGVVDPTLIPGMHGTWKNYISTSFQEVMMEHHTGENPSYWDIVIYAPKGTKGICGNGNHYFEGKPISQLNQFTWEHEYLLGRNTGYTVVSMDYENHRQVVILDEP